MTAAKRSSPRASAWPWWAAVRVLALACVGLSAYLAFRTPEIIENRVEVPVTMNDGADRNRLTRLEQLIAVRRETLGRSLAAIEAPRCDPPAVLDETRLSALLGDRMDDRARWRALLASPMRRVTGQPDPSGAMTPLDEGPPSDQGIDDDGPPSSSDSSSSTENSGPEGKAAPRAIGALRERLEKGTVLILAVPPKGTDGLSTGTGFFISDDLIVTNRHVVEPGDPRTLFVTSASLGALTKADLVAQTAHAVAGEPDFALLRVDGAKAPAVLPLAKETAKLSPVIVAGFPGMSLLLDSGFQALLSGDLSSAPDLNMNRGEIRSVRSLGSTRQIIHTADVLKGYSGGPLMDSCGRVIGVNTLIQVDQDQASKLNSAQTTNTLLAFLKQNGVAPPIDTRDCDPGG